ncbi:hypothetical protein [Leisingera sp. F5]|uniref:hypothetical protein n=1 Tax=Leisingera sp. F5 TaxID=1813816 RepID=UPI0025BB37D2|nr:hypothetical protein [Leisingera sp. F5]
MPLMLRQSAKRRLDGDYPDMPEIANGMPGIQCYQFIGLNERIDGYSKMIEQHALLNADARRLMRMHSPLCLSQWRTNGSSSARSRHRRLSQRLAMQNSSGRDAIWRQGASGQDHEAGWSLHSQAVGRRYDITRGDGETLT